MSPWLLAIWLACVTAAEVELCERNVPAKRIEPTPTVLAFRYALLSKELDAARHTLRARRWRAVFYVQPREIDVRSERRLRALARDGHALVCACDAEACAKACGRFETALGYHPFFGAGGNATLFALRVHPSTLAALEGDAALRWLSKETQERGNVRTMEQLMSAAQLACLFRAQRCEVAALGELRFERCLRVREEAAARGGGGGEMLPLLAHDFGALTDADADNPARGFVRRSRRRVDAAYRRLRRSRMAALTSTQGRVLDVAHVLYAPKGRSLLWRPTRHPRFRALFGDVGAALASEPAAASAGWGVGAGGGGLWVSYVVSLGLCVFGICGLVGSFHGGRRRYRRGIVKVADFSKIV